MFKSDINFLKLQNMPGDNLSIGVVSVLFHVPTNLSTFGSFQSTLNIHLYQTGPEILELFKHQRKNNP